MGDVTEGNALEILRQVGGIFIQSIKDAGLYDSIRQAFAVILPVQSVGVRGDQRMHSHVVVLRAITSEDGTTADWCYFDHKFLIDVVRKIRNSVRGVTVRILHQSHGGLLNGDDVKLAAGGSKGTRQTLIFMGADL